MKTVVIISHTHWDRQWYRTVQEFRIELVKMMDKLLELLQKDPNFTVFHLDGQTAIIEDYLDLRPEKQNLIRELLKTGRLKIGPWHLQPDNFIISGEALIRNLLKGTSYARELGETSFYGWLPDSFGHPAQLPQILKNFGIDTFIFSRGLGDHLEKEAMEFIWESPHQDRVFAILQHGGYYSGGNLAYPFFWGDIEASEADHHLMVKKLRKLITKSEALSSCDKIPVWNGSDHMSPEHTLSESIRFARKELPDYHIVQGSIEEYVRSIRGSSEKLQMVRGELRGGRCEAILASVLSTRMHIKQTNYRLERALERELEPLLTFVDLLGKPYPKFALDDAWDALIKNQFHDAICGCSIDQVHKEMETGYAKVEQTVNALTQEGLHYLVSEISPTKSDNSYDNSLTLLIFNPQVQSCKVSLLTSIDVPWWEGTCFGVDASGTELPVQILDKELIHDLWIPSEASAGHIMQEIPWWQEYLRYIEKRSIVDFSIDDATAPPVLELRCGDAAIEPTHIISRIIEQMAQFPEETLFRTRTFFTRLHMLIPASLPACGYTSLRLLSPVKGIQNKLVDLGVTAGDNYIENQYIRVDVDRQGEVTILHKESGELFSDVHHFQDQADRGDTYDFCPISQENERDTLLQPQKVRFAILERGPVRACIGVYYTFEVAKELDPANRDLRSGETVKLEIETRIALSWESSFVEFVTTVDNKAKDHRLRMYTFAPFQSEHLYSDGQFFIQKREIKEEQKDGWAVPPATVFPHDRWIALSDGTKGIALLSEGVPEHSAVPAEQGTYLGLTLLRCVGWLSRQDIKTRPGQGGPPIPTPDAQCPGTYSFRYAILPFTGELQKAAIVDGARQFDARPLSKPLQSDTADPLPSHSLFELSPRHLQVTALKKSEHGKQLCLRFFNPAEDPIQAKLKGELCVKRVWKARADETVLEELPCREHSPIDLELMVEGAEIVTLLLDTEIQ